MLKQKEDKINYLRNFNMGLILSLVIIILLFVSIPNKKVEEKEIFNFHEPVVTVIDIPNTIQLPNNYSLPPQSPLITNYFSSIDDPPILPDVEIREKRNESIANLDSNKLSILKNKNRIMDASTLPFVPRQIIEAVPERINGAEGQIKLRLLIGIDGNVKRYHIISNTTNDKRCELSVINALMKSRWQPILFENEKVEYWIEKSYTFN